MIPTPAPVVTVFDAPTAAELERSVRAQAAAEHGDFALARRIIGIDDAEIAQLCHADPAEIEPLPEYDLLDPAQAAAYTAARADAPPSATQQAVAQAHAAVAAIPQPGTATARAGAVDDDTRRAQLTTWHAHDHAGTTDVAGREDGWTR